MSPLQKKIRKLKLKYGEAGFMLLVNYIYPAWRSTAKFINLDHFIHLWFAASSRRLYYARAIKPTFIHGRWSHVTWQAHSSLRTSWLESNNTRKKWNQSRFARRRKVGAGDLLQIRRDSNLPYFEVEFYTKIADGRSVIYTYRASQEQFNRLRPAIRPIGKFGDDL